MRPSDLQALIDRFGALIKCWPAAQREAAHELLATSERARAILARAQAMEQALRCVPAGDDGISPQRIDRVVAAVIAKAATSTPQVSTPAPESPRSDVQRSLAAIEGAWIRYTVAMAAGALLALVVGHSLRDVVPETVAQDDTVLGSLFDAFPGTRWFGS